jgi:DNA-binding transcriptional regulator GbsR (MarR family)
MPDSRIGSSLNRILAYVTAAPQTCNELAVKTHMGVSPVSYYLAALHRMGLVRASFRKEGSHRRILYSLPNSLLPPLSSPDTHSTPQR